MMMSILLTMLMPALQVDLREVSGSLDRPLSSGPLRIYAAAGGGGERHRDVAGILVVGLTEVPFGHGGSSGSSSDQQVCYGGGVAEATGG